MDWPEIYREFEQDRNSVVAWEALQDRVRAWAQRDLWGRGAHVVEDAIANTCADVVIAFDKAHGAETFVGFALGHYRTVRRYLLEPPRIPTVRIGETFDPPAPVEVERPAGEAIFEKLEQCVGMLPPRERQAVELHYLKGVPYADVAMAMGVSVVYARQLAFLGKAGVRRCMDEAVVLRDRGRR